MWQAVNAHKTPMHKYEDKTWL